MKRSRTWFLLLLIALGGLLVGCGDEAAEPTATPTAPPTATIDPSTATPTVPSTPLPPTWTVAPTLTDPPRVTIDYEYVRPTEPPLILPTYTPTPVPLTPTPTGPTLVITPAIFDPLLNTRLADGAGGLYAAPPVVSFQPGAMLLTLDVLVTPGDVTTAREVRILTNVTTGQGRVEVFKIEAVFTDTDAVYETELVGNLIETVETELNLLIEELYRGNDPDGQMFFVSAILIDETGMTVETATIR